MSKTVAIVGRPNVGKSTLYNRLVGRRVALVHDEPGVTRDRREGDASLLGLPFRVIDTAGFEEASDDSIEARMRQQTDLALAQADVVLMLMDARAGVTPLDRAFAAILRKLPVPVVLVANKCEGKAGENGLYECYGLGLGEPVPLSAEHNEGMGDLFEALRPYIEPTADDLAAEEHDEAAEGEEDERPDRPLQLVIAGRPNVGKSTLINALLGEDRLLTGPEAGLTRDSITIDGFSHKGRALRLVDTAGIRRRANIDAPLEKLSVSNSLESIRMAEVVVLVMDPEQLMDKQDLTIARMVESEGRAMVIAINKWDTVANPEPVLKRLRDRLDTSLAQMRGIPCVCISALDRQGLDKLLDAVLSIHKLWNYRISTAKLNRWLEEILSHHPPPALAGGRRLKIRYMTEVKARPPTFVLFASKPEALPESYNRYLINGLRDAFGLDGIPIRLHVRGGKNPYAPS